MLGLLLLTWLPSLFAFVIGFTWVAQLLSAVLAVALAGGCLYFAHRKNPRLFRGFQKRDLGFLWVVVPLFAIGAYLFHTHIILPTENGLSVGQVTYGDLAMHLGFISSIAEQGIFPPQYSIFPGHTVNYPFLCETSASSLAVLGATLRQAYLITALYAYLLVLIGAWFFFREWLKTNRRASLATILFFLGSGFGFAYFFDLAKHGASLNTLLGGNYPTNFAWLLNGFYDTPTNLPTVGLRWVNPIVDMFVPQRATLFGWAFLFPCLGLLHGYVFSDKRKNILPLGLIAGALPLIHTHSFLALGIISAVYFISDLIFRFDKKRLILWLLYAGIACLLGMPQLFGFAFRQASESGMVQLHWNWANEADSYLWFYLKNLGWLFVLLPIAFFALSKRDRRVYLAPALLWLLAETLVFQPNNYDNNKLLFVWFAYTCGLVAKLLDVGYRKLCAAIRKRSAAKERSFALNAAALGIAALLLISFIVVQVNAAQIKWYTVCTLLLLAGIGAYFLIRSALEQNAVARVVAAVGSGCFLLIVLGLFIILWQEYEKTVITLSAYAPLIGCIVSALAMLFSLAGMLFSQKPAAFSRAAAMVALQLGTFLLAVTMTLSSVMTILREVKSEYQVYSKSDLEVTDFVREHTEKDSVFLANSYLWNLITPLTGRNIVTGTSTFLYFHGIDNTQRERDVRAMFESPAENEDLFHAYDVQYVMISNAERYNYDVNEAYFDEHGTVLFRNSSATVYHLP